MNRKQAVKVERELRGMCVYKPYVSADDKQRLVVESHPLIAYISQGFDVEMGPTHELKLVDWSLHGETIATRRVFMGQDLVMQVALLLKDFHQPAYDRAKAREKASLIEAQAFRLRQEQAS